MGNGPRLASVETVTHPLILHPEVWNDINAIREWYGAISPTLFNDFGTRLSDLLDRIVEYPRIYAEVESPYRRANVSRFPYQVYYVVAPDHLWLVGIFPDRAEPAATMRRLADRTSRH